MLKELNSIAADMLGLQGFPMLPFSPRGASPKATVVAENGRSAQSGIEQPEAPAVQEKDQARIAA
jgi:hypothetical protein